VQQALAAELNMQGIYDAVGDKIREIFATATSRSASSTRRERMHFPFLYESGGGSIDPRPLANRASRATSCARARRSSSTRT
jgi:hypothetical protein